LSNLFKIRKRRNILLEFMAQIEDAEEEEFGEAKKMEQNLPILRT
jgi:hypothetical protein